MSYFGFEEGHLTGKIDHPGVVIGIVLGSLIGAGVGGLIGLLKK